MDPAKVPDDARNIELYVVEKEGCGAWRCNRMLVLLGDAGMRTVDPQGESLLTPMPEDTSFA